MEINGTRADLTLSTRNSEITQQRDTRRLPAKWVAALFAKLQARYAHKWTSCYPAGQVLDTALQEWAIELGDLDGHAIALGLKTWKGDWPPNVYEFRAACLSDQPKTACHRSFPSYPAPVNRLNTRNKSLRTFFNSLHRDDNGEKTAG